MENRKKSEKNIVHQRQSPHDEKNCHINNPVHSHPDMDCEHIVNSGPGLNIGNSDKSK